MAASVKTIGLKILKWLGITIATILLLMFLIPLLFPGTVAQQVKVFANKSLDAELNFGKSKLSFFTHFPSLTVSLDDFSLKGSAPFKEETLVKADQVAFGINLFKLIFGNEIKIDKIYIDNALINVLVDENGKANYNVYVADEEQPKDTLSEGASIRLERVDIKNCHVKYNDKSAKVLLDARGFNYVGKGDLAADVFDLRTDARIDSVDFIYDKIPYLQNKRLRADLITRINTNSLSFILQKNKLRINRLPLEFTGFFTILKDGYNISIDAASENNRLKDLFSVLPPQYATWQEKTKIRGKSDLLFTFKGRYNAAKNQQPDLGFKIDVKEGFIENNQVPIPLSDFEMHLEAMMPSLDIEKLSIELKKLKFRLGKKDYFDAVFQSKGFSEMALKANAKGSLNLENLDKALGLEAFNLKGVLNTDILANGTFSIDKRLFPKIKGGINLQNGWLKTKYYPNPVTDIKFVASVQNQKGTFEDLKIAVTPASFVFEGNPVYVNATVSNFDDVAYDAKVKGELNIGRIYKVFSQKGLEVQGYAKADLSLKGRQSYATSGQYSKLDNRGTLQLKDIKTTSEYFPKPFFITEGLFRFQNEKMWFDKFSANYGKSDFAVNGYLLNTINYFLESHGTLSGNFNVKSKLIAVDEFMALEEGENKDRKPAVEAAKAEAPKASGVVVLPTNLNVSLVADANKVEYTGLVLNNLKGKVGIKKGTAYLQNASFDIIDCKVGIDAQYDDESPTAANFNAHFKAKDFNVKRAYNEIPLFHDLATAAANAEGIISVDYTIKGDLDANMGPVYPSLKGGGTVSVRDVKMSGFKLFNAVSKKTGRESLDDPNIKDIKIKTTIANNLIKIEPFTFKASLFRPTIKGTTSFDGLLDIHIRLGLPPGGIVGIPLVVTGTHENPKVKIFSKTGQNIEEAQYNENTNTLIKKEKVEAKPKDDKSKEDKPKEDKPKQ